jgi:hypothetical protein
MFNKELKVVLLTSLKNGDNLKISKLADMYVKKGTIIDIYADGDDVKISFIINRKQVSEVVKSVDLLSYCGVIVKILN